MIAYLVGYAAAALTLTLPLLVLDTLTGSAPWSRRV
jgi:hypothetical protein